MQDHCKSYHLAGLVSKGTKFRRIKFERDQVNEILFVQQDNSEITLVISKAHHIWARERGEELYLTLNVLMVNTH